MKLGQRWTLLVFLGVAAACQDGTGLSADDLEGIWVATSYEFTDNANPQSKVDVIQRDGASFTLTVDDDGIASTLFLNGLGSSSSDSGTMSSAGDRLTVGGVTFDASRNGDVLTLTNASAQFDFGTGSSVPATLQIELSRD